MVMPRTQNDDLDTDPEKGLPDETGSLIGYPPAPKLNV